LKRAHTHEPARTDCIACHNPHNSANRKLLLRETRTLCTACHEKVGVGVKVEHKALSSGAQCSNCHDPHGSAVAKLLKQRPFELCLSCHNVDTMADASGKKMQNIKSWLDSNKVWHGPVREKDCNGCHQPHGGDHFRMLEEEYPQDFYAKYDAKTYALCFSCHNDDAFSKPETTTLTGFRDGSRNLHYVHLQQAGRGRTCRACHEVHAGKQKNFIRDGVPYGSSGWMLKLNYKETADGGSCEKTCHVAKTYVNNIKR
jgi:predicted CXXCH cytochrome family protein